VREVTRVYRRMAVSDAVAMLAFVLRKDRAIA
jgi:ribosomal protein L22